MVEIEEHIGFKNAVNFAGYAFCSFFPINFLCLEEKKIQKKYGYFTMWEIGWWCAYGTGEHKLLKRLWMSSCNLPTNGGLLAVCSNQLLHSKTPAAGLN